MKYRLYPIYILSVGLLCLATTRAEEVYEEKSESSQTFKLFGRTKKDNPAEQLAYADQLRQHKKLRKARRHYKALIQRWPTSREAARAQYMYAGLLHAAGKMRPAAEQYEYLLENYTEYFPYERTLEQLFQIGVYFLEKRKARFLMFSGFAAPERAIPIFEAVLQYGPEWEKADEAQYTIGRAYQLTHDLESAITAYAATQFRYPQSAWAEEAAFYEAQCLYLLSKERPYNLDKAHAAWASFNQFLQKYSASTHVEEAASYRQQLTRKRAKISYEKALFYDKDGKSPEAALRAYRQFMESFPDSEWTAWVEERINILSGSATGDPEPVPNPVQSTEKARSRFHGASPSKPLLLQSGND